MHGNLRAICAKGKKGVIQNMEIRPGRLVLASGFSWVSVHVKGIKL